MILIINDLNYPSKISNLPLRCKIKHHQIFPQTFHSLSILDESQSTKKQATTSTPSIPQSRGFQCLESNHCPNLNSPGIWRIVFHGGRRTHPVDRSSRNDGRGVGVAYTPLKSYARRGVYTHPVRPAPLTLIRSAEAAPNTKRAGRCSAPRSELTRECGTGPTRMQKKRRAGRFFCARRT